MRRRFAAILLLLLAACAAQQLGRKSPVAQPEIVIEQLSSVASAARNVTGGISVHYRIRVRNVANEPVTLKRIDLVTVGPGSYNLGPLSRPFDVTIKSGSESSVEVWGPANITDPSVAGANGPVTLRAIVLFDSPAGRMQTVVMQPVRSATGVD
jgi:hypothetical protein